jgi:hypothetical protein
MPGAGSKYLTGRENSRRKFFSGLALHESFRRAYSPKLRLDAAVACADIAYSDLDFKRALVWSSPLPPELNVAFGDEFSRQSGH